jgi:outer membrane protein insertion porin family
VLDDFLRFLRRALPPGLCLVLLAVLAGGALAQGAEEEALRVGRVSVTGNVQTDSTRILRTFEILPGSRFSQDAVRRGVRKLVALGLFSDVKVNRAEHDGVIDLVVVVQERPRLGSIKYTGNKKRENVDLEKKTFLRAGDTYSAVQVQTQIDSLLKYYRSEGFARAKVTPKLDTLAATNQIDLTFVVEEGEKVRITAIKFDGLGAFAEGKLRKAMKTKKHWLLGGGDLKDENFPEDREKLERWYQDHGYRDMRVAGFDLVPGAQPRDLTLLVHIEEGRRYVMGDVTWTGNKVVPFVLLQRLWDGKPGEPYSRSDIEKVVQGVYGEYAEHGYLYLGVEPRETVRDSIVDLAFAVTEGAPSHVRLISFTGNKGTRENVVRRELAIHEGDTFRRSALVRSQGDMMRLGLFEEVIPDFTPAESTDVDLVFKLKEKQVGTASAGAGYTSQTGLTGFLELGHNNVLGNGQQLALHVERGGKRQDYSLSFTEPWFRDTPTLLGFSGYSTTQILTEYDQRRRGGSARIGRPLRWPDYSRLSVAYTLEKILVSNVRDSLLLTGVTVGQDQITSSMEFNFLRNSTDNPFYATRGTRLNSLDLFAGGPLGGQVSFHSHRYEGRAYFRSLFKRMTTMVRMRIGLMGQYPWKDGVVVPDYARFRLGGGNTLDPLRGYDDYQVVPEENIRRDSVYVKTDRNPTDGVDTLRFSYVRVTRYPGGAYYGLVTFEQQFPILHPLHGVLFFDAGNVWNYRDRIQPFNLRKGAGIGFRMEIPILGNIGFDYGYGFDRDDGPRWKGHFLMGNMGF